MGGMALFGVCPHKSIALQAWSEHDDDGGGDIVEVLHVMRLNRAEC